MPPSRPSATTRLPAPRAAGSHRPDPPPRPRRPAFLADNDPAKRDKLIDRLLASPAYADFFANKWSAILGTSAKRDPITARGIIDFYDWIRETIAPTSRSTSSCRELLTASGRLRESPPVIGYRSPTRGKAGRRHGPALPRHADAVRRCHHHPFENGARTTTTASRLLLARLAARPVRRRPAWRVITSAASGDGHRPRNGKCVRPAASAAPARFLGRRRPARKPGRLDGRQRTTRSSPGAGQPLLEALLQPRHRRARGRHAANEPADESRALWSAGPALSSPAASI